MSAGTKADSEGTLVRPNQVNDQVKTVQPSSRLRLPVTLWRCEFKQATALHRDSSFSIFGTSRRRVTSVIKMIYE